MVNLFLVNLQQQRATECAFKELNSTSIHIATPMVVAGYTQVYIYCKELAWLASFPGIYVWTEKKEPGTQYLCMLSS